MTPATTAGRILVADDQPDVIEALRLLLKGEGFEIDAARSPEAVLRAVEHDEFDAVIMDLNYTRDTTSGQEGLDLVPRLCGLDPTLPTIVMTAWGSVESAVDAMRRGARDYIEKPWDNGRLLATLRTQVELGRALRAARRLESENRLLRGDKVPALIAASPTMQPVLRLIERIGPSDANVLITGEHGTGKELVARSLHALSPRSEKPLVTVDMGGLAENVFESEMFGHVRGAFTDAKSDRMGRFELADRGTLFLDEIANLQPQQQSKLLRVLQTGEMERVGSSRTIRVDVRVITATNAELLTIVREGRFREDLLFRLNTIEIRLPPLRDRREDIPALATVFLRRHATRYGKRLTSFDAGAMQALLAHGWPGNVRELDHAIERAVLMGRGETVTAADLAFQGAASAAPRLEDMPLEEVERVLIQKALERHGGNVSQAAKVLGLSRSALYRRIAHHGF